ILAFGFEIDCGPKLRFCRTGDGWESINSSVASVSCLVSVCVSGSCDPNECVELTIRESSVCDIVCSSHEPVSFSQLKKSTNFHQEILSRIVRRLAVHGLMRKVDGKY